MHSIRRSGQKCCTVLFLEIDVAVRFTNGIRLSGDGNIIGIPLFRIKLHAERRNVQTADILRKAVRLRSRSSLTLEVDLRAVQPVECTAVQRLQGCRQDQCFQVSSLKCALSDLGHALRYGISTGYLFCQTVQHSAVFCI